MQLFPLTFMSHLWYNLTEFTNLFMLYLHNLEAWCYFCFLTNQIEFDLHRMEISSIDYYNLFYDGNVRLIV